MGWLSVEGMKIIKSQDVFSQEEIGTYLWLPKIVCPNWKNCDVKLMGMDYIIALLMLGIVPKALYMFYPI